LEHPRLPARRRRGPQSLHARGKDAERDTPPAEPLLVAFLKKPQADGLSTLVLIDEVELAQARSCRSSPA
jgi:hypothetical protein